MLRRLAVPALTLALLAVAAPAHADDPVDVPDGATITIDGRGHGHGRGMSQEGAANRAEAGQDHREILGFYYPGTQVGTATGNVRIFLSEGDLRNAVQVRPQRGLVARNADRNWNLMKARPRATAWRILPKGDARTVLQYRQKGWHQYRSSVKGTLEFNANGRPITLQTQAGPAAYRGIIRSVPSSPGNRIAVNVLPLEAYLRGVVPAELVASQAPSEAQQAQAVAARSYAALKRVERSDKIFDLDDTPGYQAYGGVGAEYPASDRAVAATAGEILTYAGEPAFAEFTASNGGWTVVGDEPYLTAQQDPYDTDDWGPVDFTPAEIEARWPAIGDLTSIQLVRDRSYEDGGRVESIMLSGSAGVVTVSGTTFYQRLDLQSPWLTVTVD